MKTHCSFDTMAWPNPRYAQKLLLDDAAGRKLIGDSPAMVRSIVTAYAVLIKLPIRERERIVAAIKRCEKAELEEEKMEQAVREVFPLKPKAMIEYLDLLRPIFKKTAALGHFGRDDPDFTWEKTDRVKDLRKACGL